MLVHSPLTRAYVLPAPAHSAVLLAPPWSGALLLAWGPVNLPLGRGTRARTRPRQLMVGRLALGFPGPRASYPNAHRLIGTSLGTPCNA
jgi:hypothetical protein